MKANEAPYKIYLLSTPYRMLDGWYRDKSPIPPSFEQVEYSRTDAFIKKACSWLENNLQGIVGGSIYIEDFRTYMKGE